MTVWVYDSVTQWQMHSKNKNKKETITNIKTMALMLDRPTNFKYIQDFQYMSVLCVPFVILVLFVKVEINHHKFEKLA